MREACAKGSTTLIISYYKAESLLISNIHLDEVGAWLCRDVNYIVVTMVTCYHLTTGIVLLHNSDSI